MLSGSRGRRMSKAKMSKNSLKDNIMVASAARAVTAQRFYQQSNNKNDVQCKRTLATSNKTTMESVWKIVKESNLGKMAVWSFADAEQMLHETIAGVAAQISARAEYEVEAAYALGVVDPGLNLTRNSFSNVVKELDSGMMLFSPTRSPKSGSRPRSKTHSRDKAAMSAADLAADDSETGRPRGVTHTRSRAVTESELDWVYDADYNDAYARSLLVALTIEPEPGDDVEMDVAEAERVEELKRAAEAKRVEASDAKAWDKEREKESSEEALSHSDFSTQLDDTMRSKALDLITPDSVKSLTKKVTIYTTHMLKGEFLWSIPARVKAGLTYWDGKQSVVRPLTSLSSTKYVDVVVGERVLYMAGKSIELVKFCDYLEGQPIYPRMLNKSGTWTTHRDGKGELYMTIARAGDAKSVDSVQKALLDGLVKGVVKVLAPLPNAISFAECMAGWAESAKAKVPRISDIVAGSLKRRSDGGKDESRSDPRDVAIKKVMEELDEKTIEDVSAMTAKRGKSAPVKVWTKARDKLRGYMKPNLVITIGPYARPETATTTVIRLHPCGRGDKIVQFGHVAMVINAIADGTLPIK